MLVDPCLNAGMGPLRDALSLTHQGKEQQLPRIFLGAAKGCALWGSPMNLVSTTTATPGTSEPGSEPRNTMKTRAKPRDPPSAEANVVPLFVLPTQPEEGKSLQIHVERKSKARIAFPTNSSANGPKPGPVLAAHQPNCSHPRELHLKTRQWAPSLLAEQLTS